MLKSKNGSVRSIDIARALGFSKPSVSIAMKQLRENGYVLVDENGFIDLTEAGHEIAARMLERHLVLSQMLIGLGVDPAVAREDACRIEHDISDESFYSIKAHLIENGRLEE